MCEFMCMYACARVRMCVSVCRRMSIYACECALRVCVCTCVDI